MTESISVAYVFSNDEKNVIKNNFTSHSDWNNNVFIPLKSNIISHLRTEQDNKCCYCKNDLGFDIKQVDIEHIIPKSKQQKFTFTGKNLALSCPACNTKKSTNCVLKRKAIVYYPKSGSNFKIVHAHFDNYSDHITIENDCIYIPSTKKGSETITICELFRLRIVHEKSKKFSTSRSTISKLVEDLRTSSADEVNDFIQLIKGHIR